MEAHPCLMRFLTNLARLCASKSANGPRKNSFRPDSPPHDTLQPGTEDSVIPLATPDMVRSGRVLQPQLNLHLERGITVLHRLLSIGNM